MSRLNRRHDDLLREYLDVARQQSAAHGQGDTRQAERLAVRERALAAGLRQLRLKLGLPVSFDPQLEAARLESLRGRSRVFAKGRADRDALEWPDRPRVRPVPAARPAGPESDLSDVDAPLELVSYAARFFARRAADETLDHRQSAARGHVSGDVAAWPTKPLARSANGEIFAGTAGRLMGELVGRGFDTHEARAYARVAVQSYADEFSTVVVAGLRRERDAVEQLGRRLDDVSPHRLVELERILVRAACAAIAAEVRAARHARSVTAAEVGALGGLGPDHRPGG